MELPIFTHLSPVGSFSAHYFGIPGSDCKSPNSESDNSMDAEVHDPLKLKQTTDEDFFSWAGEIRVSLDGVKNDLYNSIELQTKSDQNQLTKINQQLSDQYNERDCEQNNIDQFRCENHYEKLNQPQVQNNNNIVKTSYEGISNGQAKVFEAYSKVQEQVNFAKDQNRMGNKEEERFGKHSGQYPKSGNKAMMKGGIVTREVSDGVARTEIDLYLEKSQMAVTGNQVEAAASGTARKRKLEVTAGWQGGKVARVSGANNQRDMISSGRISSGWQVDDIDIDLPGELTNPSYNMSEALLSLPVFKEEAPSPTGGNSSSPPWLNRQNTLMNTNMNMTNNVTNNSPDQQSNMSQMQGQNCNNRNQQQGIQHPNANQMNHMMVQQHGSQQMQGSYAPNEGAIAVSQGNADRSVMDITSEMLICSPHTSMDNFSSCANRPIQQIPDSAGSSDNRFQYVLAAATSIATKCNEDTLTYLNQCQSYEIKLKKLGDLSHYRGKLLKSIIRICFHERRLQYAEREQMAQWQNERPGERIVEVDVPLSYGLIHVSQPTEQPLLNTVELFWDPVKEAGVYIKVNCISTEFTAKKHGGEKGVPFRIQVETFLPGEGPPGTSTTPKGVTPHPDKRLHAAACQIKVFKLKGADRKHKQDREKILRRPECEREKYQPSYECTVFTDLANDAVFSPSGLSSQPYSPECGPLPSRPSAPSSASPPRIDAPLQQLVFSPPHNDIKIQQSLSRVNSHGSSLDCDEEIPSKPLIQGTPVSPSEVFEPSILTEVATASETRLWLTRNRFATLIPTFSNFSGADLLRLSRDDLIQICSLADGIRLYNALHAEHAPARLTLYAKKMGEKPFSAIYLRTYQASELKRKLFSVMQDGSCMMLSETPSIFVAGPNGIRINLTDEVIQNIRNDSMFCLESVEGGVVMRPA